VLNKKKKSTESKARELIDSLFAEKATDLSESRRLVGNIDTLNNRVLSGWVVDQDALGDSVNFDVFYGKYKVGEGRADIYRGDLEEAGYGDGAHGFQVTLNSRIYSLEMTPLTIKEKDSGVVVSTNQFFVDTKSDCFAEVIGIGIREIQAQVFRNNQSKELHSVEILVDGLTRLPCALTNEAGKTRHYEARIPNELFDGMPHSYEVIANDQNVSSTAFVDILAPIVTPAEHLTDSVSAPGYIGLARSAAYRYDSLNQQLARYTPWESTDSTSSEGNDIAIKQMDELANLCKAHKEVVRGFEKRKQFPCLKLPKIDNPDVSIIIPAKDKFAITYHCIASIILACNKSSYEVILVDDGSVDETTNAENIVENLVVVRNEDNLGFIRSNNKAAGKVRGRYICLLNNDTEVTVGWIDEALEMFELYNDVGSVGCRLIYPDGVLQEAGGIVWGNGQPWNYGKNKNASHPSFNYARNADYLSAAALFVDSDVWVEVGGFSDEFAPAYYEDTDLAYKIRAAGYKTIYCPTSVVVHFEGKSNGTSTKSGIKKYQEINSKKFRSKWFEEYKEGGMAGVDPHLEVDKGYNYRILVLDADTPRRNSDAGSYAAFQEMKLMMELGCKLTFIPGNVAHMGVHTNHLQKLGVECIYYPFYQSIEQFLNQRGSEFDAVYITRYQVAANLLGPIREKTNAKIVFNNADLHFLRELRQKLQSEDRDFSGPLSTREKELKVINEVDVALCYTDAERAVVTSHVLKEGNILRCPWVVKAQSDIPDFDSRTDIAFLGGYRHTPNIEAVKYFCENVVPELARRLPDVTFRVYGSHMPESFDEYCSDNVVMHGFIEDVSDIYRGSRVFVSPLLSGAGIKGKILECMAAGLPSVVSPVSAEGTGLVHSQSSFIASTVDEWVEHIVTLYTDREVWEKFSMNSASIAKAVYSPEQGVRQMKKILEYIDLFSTVSDEFKYSEFSK